MANFFAELKRRQMFRVAAAYAVVAWVLLQVVNNVAPALRLPDWAATLVLVLLIVGFPVALLFCWIQQLAPNGESSKTTTGKLDWVLIGALIVVIGLVSYQQLATSSVTQQAGVEAAKSAAASPRTGISLAVLPFANLSSDKEQEFFSDGITEEIITALAKIPDLRVVARESAFQYKGEKNDMRTVGQALNATHLMGGSVRKVGDRVRITAQLVKADDGVNIWADSYDRELNDVFAIQEDIARAIAASLRMPLGLRPGENLVANRNIDLELYELFLRMRAQVRADPRTSSQANVLRELEKLVAREPDFAPAWGYMSRLYILSQGGLYFRLMTLPIDETRQQWRAAFEKSEKAAREAIRLDPTQALAHTTLAFVEVNRKNWTGAEDYLRKALEIDPDDPDVLSSQGYFFLQTGRLKESLVTMEQARAMEPLGPGFRTSTARAMLANGQADDAIALLEGTRDLRWAHFSALAQAYAMAGRYDDAANAILSPSLNRSLFGDARAVEEAARLIRNAPTKVSDPAALPALPLWLSFVYGFVGAPERQMDYPERAVAVDDLAGVVSFSVDAPVRKTERFKTFVRNVGLVDYWRARGWPDLCKPVGANNFACE
jgi:TolB-like protein